MGGNPVLGADAEGIEVTDADGGDEASGAAEGTGTSNAVGDDVFA